jgi:hypothetical protein
MIHIPLHSANACPILATYFVANAGDRARMKEAVEAKMTVDWSECDLVESVAGKAH